MVYAEYEEYLGVTLSTEHNRNATLGKCLALSKPNPDWISFDFGIHVKDDYINGAVLLLFMHESFGKAKVHALLRSEDRSFGRALTATTGVHLEEFQKRFQTGYSKKQQD